MAFYLENYLIDGMRYGIEDYKDGRPADEHFFFEDFASGKSKRFRCWRGGCGFAQHDTLDEARVAIRDRALLRAMDKVESSLAEASAAGKVVEVLKADDIFKLAKFLEGF